MTPEELRAARIAEASRRLRESGANPAGIMADMWAENWTPPEPVDPDLLAARAKGLVEALEETWRVLRSAGLLNLTNGVQLGATSWYVKICDAEVKSDAALASAKRGG